MLKKPLVRRINTVVPVDAPPPPVPDPTSMPDPIGTPPIVRYSNPFSANAPSILVASRSLTLFTKTNASSVASMVSSVAS